MVEQNAEHPFQRTLGLGPYKFVGMFSINLEAGKQGRPYYNANEMHPNFIRGAGTCAHCGHAILNIYQIQIGNGEVYGVGSDCIEKVGMPAKELSKIEAIAREHAKAKRAKLKANKGDKARAEIRALIEKQHELMASKKHPHIFTLTLLDYATWVLEHSSDGGVIASLGRIKSQLTK